MTAPGSQNNSDLFDGFRNGSLHIHLVSQPDYFFNEETQDARYIELDFHAGDWEALFFNALHCPARDEYETGEDITEYHERNRRKFAQSIPTNPMLGRIFDMYEDYLYTLDEVPRLRVECLKVMATVRDSEALKALRKLVFACDQASSGGFHLAFTCD